MAIEIEVNGRPVEALVPDDQLLADFVRDGLGLYGTRLGCHEGVCGTCTVLVDGQPIRSCLVYAAQLEGSAVLTVEGLGGPGALSPLQQAFIESGAAQCGFCTAGILLTATALLAEIARPTEDEIREALAGNICRCTGYVKIVEAIASAAQASAAPFPERPPGRPPA